MRYEIVLTDTAKEHYRGIPARWRSIVRDGLETHLRHEPTKTSRSRIKRLRGVDRPEYRLRLEDYQVFYDVEAETVVVLAIVPKEDTENWLDQYGVKSL
ncbi:type II toxin-antitoxin system RelE family toxin [Candidatus Thiosymbion oneisti]|uniref:type II toxin-antitoxin system RelE family toxin n=1 Tax=Candidatus Thiosymbion oneisti TaxID=589554 RepID=UPI000B7C89F8|nr:type II toxin-antitoxin system RelE/ParE family toxin [Candidatus Thiosymbion oneisti]